MWEGCASAPTCLQHPGCSLMQRQGSVAHALPCSPQVLHCLAHASPSADTSCCTLQEPCFPAAPTSCAAHLGTCFSAVLTPVCRARREQRRKQWPDTYLAPGLYSQRTERGGRSLTTAQGGHSQMAARKDHSQGRQAAGQRGYVLTALTGVGVSGHLVVLCKQAAEMQRMWGSWGQGERAAQS